MTTTETTELLRRWASAKFDLPLDDILEVGFRHEDGWTNDSGTSWPEENHAVITLRRHQAHGREGRPRTVEHGLPGGMENTPTLLAEILAIGGGS